MLDGYNSGPGSAAGGVPEERPRDGKPYADAFGWLSHTYDTP